MFLQLIIKGNPDVFSMHGPNFLRNNVLYNRVSALAKENRIHVLNFDISEEKDLSLVLTALNELELKLTLVDLSNCYFKNFLGIQGVFKVIDAMKHYCHKNAIYIESDSDTLTGSCFSLGSSIFNGTTYKAAPWLGRMFTCYWVVLISSFIENSKENGGLRSLILSSGFGHGQTRHSSLRAMIEKSFERYAQG